MTIAQGVEKRLAIKRQTVKGTLAGATLGQIMRRETSSFELQKESYTTESEITSVKQVKSSRHGVKQVNGSLNGIFSPGTYSDPLSAVLRRDFAAVAALTGLAIAVAGTPGAYTLTTTGLLAGGLKVGMIIRVTAGTGLNADVLNKNLLVNSVTATVATCSVVNGSTMTTGSGTACTITVPGKVSYAPDTGHTNIYYTVEEWYPDALVSEINQDVKFTKADISLPGSGNATIKFSALGLDQTSAAAAYFTSPAVESSSDVLTAAGGILMLNGVGVATVTDLSINIDDKATAADGVVGSNIRPDIFNGVLNVSGSFTAYFEGGTIPNLFINETATSIVSALTNGSAANADFVTLTMTNVKLNTSTPGDSQTGLKRSYNFVAIYNAAGGAALANHATSIMVCDSLAA